MPKVEWTKKPTDQEILDKSEFNMGQLHFLRYDKILTKMDELGIIVISYQSSIVEINLYYAALKILYLNIKPRLLDKTIKDFETIFAEAKKLRIEYANLKQIPGRNLQSEPLIDKLEEIHTQLINSWFKHLGLGYPMTKEISKEKKVKAALLGQTKGDKA